MWFGSWFGTEYTGLWWGDGGIIPPPPTPADEYPLGLKNVAWRPLKRPPADITISRKSQKEVNNAPFPAEIDHFSALAPQIAPSPQIAPLPAPLSIDVGGIERQVEAALRGELSRAKAGARATSAPDAPAPDPVEDDAEDLEAIIVLMHVI